MRAGAGVVPSCVDALIKVRLDNLLSQYKVIAQEDRKCYYHPKQGF